MIPALDGVTGQLPVGRYPCTPLQVQARFVDVGNPDAEAIRRPIWAHWCYLTSLLREVVPVCAAWLGGGFITGKPDPADVDSVYLIRDADLDSLTDPDERRFVSLFTRPNLLKSRGYDVDAYVLSWRPNPEVGPRDALDVAYLQTRGYWDDFWQRIRPPPAAPGDAALPGRGYLEVILDGFTV